MTPDRPKHRDHNDEIAGIALDQWGNPSAYGVLKRHPGDSGVFRTPIDDLTAYDKFAAASLMHYFRVDLPGQLRGIPDITPALPLFAQLRPYTLETIAAAETAASFAAVICTDSPATPPRRGRPAGADGRGRARAADGHGSSGLLETRAGPRRSADHHA